MLVRRSLKLKADKNIFSGFMAWYGLGCKIMVDLIKLRSSDMTAWEGRLFHCTTAKGKKEYL